MKLDQNNNPRANTPPKGRPINVSQQTNLIQRFLEDVERAGLVGEKNNAVTVFLCAVSAKLDRPLSLTVQGASSAGKNHLLSRVASFIPPKSKKFLTGMTPKTLMHAGENEYRHKAVFIAEYEGVARADYAIRTFQSEQVIEWEFVESSKEGIRKRSKVVRGPASFIQATTRPVLHQENETRLLFIQIDESPRLTREIISQQAREAAGGAVPPPEELFHAWHDLIAGLELTSVIIPFAEQLVPHFSDTRVRSRRDFPKLLSLIQASAFLHQHDREKDDGKVIAEPGDYLIAKPLFENAYSVGPDRAVTEFLKAADAIQDSNGNFCVADLMETTKWGKSWTYEVLGRAEELGCIADGDRRGSYRFLRHSPISPLQLPQTLSVE